MSIETEFKKIIDLITHILERHPETRDSDTLLYIKCCEYLGANTIDDLKKLNLNLISVHKTRQHVQNKLGMFRPSKEIQEHRAKRSVEIREYMSRLA